MKKIIFIIIAVIVINDLYSQSNWTFINYNGSLNGTSFCNANTGWTIGYNGMIFKTTNGGLNWLRQNNSTPAKYLNSISALSPDTCIAAGSNRSLIMTTNGGINWIDVNSYQNTGYNSLTFANRNTGWVLSSNKIFKTTNSGLNWTLTDSLPVYLKMIQFTDINTGYALKYDNSVLFKSIDGGYNWNQITTPYSNVVSFHFLNSNTGFCTGNGKLTKTTDGGLNWSLVFTHTYSWIYLYYSNINTAYTLDNFGAIYKSQNSGLNWTYIKSDTTGHYNRWMYVQDSMNIYYGTNYQRLNKSSTGGTTWVTVIKSDYPEFGDFTGSNFFDANTGYFYSGNYITKTTNTGLNFSRTSINNFSGSRIHFCNPNTGYRTVSSSSVYKTTNGGDYWFSTCNFQNVGFFNLYFLNQNTGWAVGFYQDVLIFNMELCLARTTNGGINWLIYHNYPMTLGSFRSAYFINENTGWCKGVNEDGSSKFIATTTNGGINFVNIKSIETETGGEFLINANTGFAAAGTNIYKTTNSGANWLISTFSNCDFRDVFFVNDSTGWICGDRGEILKTTNQGVNWIQNSAGFWAELRTIEFINENTGFIAGNNGLIMKTTNGGNVFISNTGKEIPQGYSLEQNYPNPFNAVTNVKFEMLNGGEVKIVVYDVAGKEVAVLVNEELEAGVYEVRFDGGDLPSGIYFYRMQTEKFTETKKLILLK